MVNHLNRGNQQKQVTNKNFISCVFLAYLKWELSEFSLKGCLNVKVMVRPVWLNWPN